MKILTYNELIAIAKKKINRFSNLTFLTFKK